jgi:hypothetical protein
MPVKKANINRLKAMISKGPTKAQQEKALKHYEDRKIANILTVENLVSKLQSSNKRVVEKGLKELFYEYYTNTFNNCYADYLRLTNYPLTVLDNEILQKLFSKIEEKKNRPRMTIRTHLRTPCPT